MSVPRQKKCPICGVVFSDLDEPGTNYYRHIRKKYCDQCREIVWNQQVTVNMKKYRANKRAMRDEVVTGLTLLREENRILRERLRRMSKGDLI